MILIVVLGVDAFRTLFESAFFGAWYTSLSGLIPRSIQVFLVQPHIVFIPKVINVIAAVIVITILLRRWIPQEAIETRRQRQKIEHLDDLVRERTAQLQATNEQFRNEIAERRIAQEALRKAHDELEDKVAERTAELSRANARLKELDRLKSMFIASMSHELRTPLNSIIGFTGILLMGMAGELKTEQKKQLTMVKSSADHLLALINDIIDLSKIEAGKVEVLAKEFDLSTIVKEVKDSFLVALDEKGLKMPIEMPNKLSVESDERRVKQIIVNLVGNAVKFTEQGEIGIAVAKRDGIIEVSVRDTGIGIKKEHLDRLFTAFSQVSTEGAISEGSGLGLYLSQKIAELLGGRITAKSELGRGSEFILTLPSKYEESMA